MNVEHIRASFIESQLDRALADPGSSMASRVVDEFGRYIRWYSETLPAHERDEIAGKLGRLERAIAQRKLK